VLPPPRSTLTAESVERKLRLGSELKDVGLLSGEPAAFRSELTGRERLDLRQRPLAQPARLDALTPSRLLHEGARPRLLAAADIVKYGFL
jgi:hypothetical protein